ncbi:uncharacterized protein [Temnothorax nylanderi]|uniref:uncharacterized protein n=1 Tax=Temnothorax nylanderi TaxID=102681 RepID=UPI003A8A02A5
MAQMEKRGANFTKTEVDLLIDITLKYKHIVENKRTDATTWKDKNEAWEKICNEFNAVSGNFPRSTKTIRAKYDTVKKNIRKKCSLLKSEQTKTGGGQCPVPLTPCEEKILSLTPNTMVGLQSRFDKDSQYAEPGQSGSTQWTTQQDAEEESEPNIADADILFVDDENDDIFQFLKRTKNVGKENVGVPKAPLISSEKSANTEKPHMEKKIDAVDSVREINKRKGTDAKFIFKNKRIKPFTENPQITEQNLHARNRR